MTREQEAITVRFVINGNTVKAAVYHLPEPGLIVNILGKRFRVQAVWNDAFNRPHASVEEE